MIAAVVKVLATRPQLPMRPSKDAMEIVSSTDRTPFGAAALEQGIEVAGFWTPQSQTPQSSLEQLPCARNETSQQVKLNIQPTANLETDIKDVSHEQPSTANTTATLTSSTSCSLFMMQHPDFGRALDAIEAEYQASKREEGRKDSEHACEPQPGDQIHKTYSHTASRMPRARHSTDLTMLDRQRYRQAAEIGQISQRSRHRSSH